MAADRQNGDAMNALGVCHEKGLGVRVNKTQAMQYYRASGKSGVTDGKYNCGRCYCYAIGTQRDYREARVQLLRAAHAGSVDAMLLLGECFADGWGGPVDSRQAYVYYNMAAEAHPGAAADPGDAVGGRIRDGEARDSRARAEAQYRIAVLYAAGRLPVSEDATVPVYLGRAAVAGHAETMEVLKFLFARKPHPFLSDLLAAIPTPTELRGEPEPLSAADDPAFAETYNRLGEAFFYGNLFPQNASMAVSCYRIAAKLGSVGAQYSLGWCLKQGHGVRAAEEEAVEWLLKAAKAGNPDACYSLGLCYDRGIGLRMRNRREAMNWFSKAAKFGHPGALRMMNREKEREDS